MQIKLVPAVTVAVAYSEYLDAMARNQKGCVPWYVVCTPDDTHELSSFPANLIPVGARFAQGFHAGYNKSFWINAGLSRCCDEIGVRGETQTEMWGVVLDADILLPCDFSERLDSLLPFLRREMIYGLRGRRVSLSDAEFSALSNLEPIESSLQISSKVIGYFQLFDFNTKNGRYLSSCTGRSQHDDLAFRERFVASHELPFAALHLGPTHVNWGGLQSNTAPMMCAECSSLKKAIFSKFLSRGSGATVVSVGIWSAEAITSISRKVRSVFIFDTRNLSQRSEDILEEADRIFCWNRFVQGVADCPNVFLVGSVDMTPLPVPNSDEVRVRLPMRTAPMPEDGSVDHIHFGHEPAHEFIFEKLVPVLGKLKPGGWLSGTHYGLPGFPQTTSTIELLLGTPDKRDEAGNWAIQLPAKDAKGTKDLSLWRFSRLSRAEKRGVVLYVHDAEDATRALVALFSLRQQYDGGIAVLMLGKEVPALRIACARWSVEYVSIMDEAKARGDSLLQGSVSGEPAGFAREQARLLAMGYSPFAQTVMVGTDSTMPQLKQWWKALSVAGPSRSRTSPKGAGLSPYLWKDDGEKVVGFDCENAGFSRWQKRMRKSLNGPIRKQFDASGACRIKGSGTLPLLVSPEAEAALIAANPAHVWWPENCTVLTAPLAEDMETLEKNWRAIRWPDDCRKRIVEIGEDGVFSVEGKLNPCFADQAYWIQVIVAVAAQCKTKRLLYIDPWMRPVPGAELFYRQEDQNAAYASAGWCFVRRGKKVLKTPKLGPPATLFDVAFLKRAVKAFRTEKKERNFEVFLHAFAKQEKRTVTVQDVMPCGWNR
jgi:hypothetical protein